MEDHAWPCPARTSRPTSTHATPRRLICPLSYRPRRNSSTSVRMPRAICFGRMVPVTVICVPSRPGAHRHAAPITFFTWAVKVCCCGSCASTVAPMCAAAVAPGAAVGRPPGWSAQSPAALRAAWIREASGRSHPGAPRAGAGVVFVVSYPPSVYRLCEDGSASPTSVRPPLPRSCSASAPTRIPPGRIPANLPQDRRAVAGDDHKAVGLAARGHGSWRYDRDPGARMGEVTPASCGGNARHHSCPSLLR